MQEDPPQHLRLYPPVLRLYCAPNSRPPAGIISDSRLDSAGLRVYSPLLSLPPFHVATH